MTRFISGTDSEDQVFQDGRFDIGGKLNVYGGPIKIKQLTIGSAGLSVTPIGGGSTSYSYKITALTHDGESLPSVAATTAAGAATLDSTHYNTVAWWPVPGARAYRVYGRSSGSEQLLKTIPVADLVQAVFFVDDGSLTSSGALPTANTTGNLNVAGQTGLGGVVTLTPTSGSGLPWQVVTSESASSGVALKGNGVSGSSPQILIFPDAHSFQGLYIEAGGASGADINFRMSPSGTTAMKIKQGNGSIELNRTLTAAGTTGNQTINKISGTVNIAAAGTSVTVTNSLVTTSSIVLCVLRTNDATARIASVVPGSGSFTINLTAAATGEVSVGFVVYN